jgi:uncharacterized membrane protein (DUF485 family)
MRPVDPWDGAFASGWRAWDTSGRPAGAVPDESSGDPNSLCPGTGYRYLQGQRRAACDEVRTQYRRFVVPAMVGFLLWYLAYVITATVAPGFMARPVAGAVNVAVIAGFGQFLSTFALTWAYARHARLSSARAALEVRGKTQELIRASDDPS